MFKVVSPCAPRASKTVNLTVYSPGLVKICVGLASKLLEVPSPKSHKYLITVTSSVLLLPVKLTDSGLIPPVIFELATATGD